MNLGKTGLRVSRIWLGMMRYGKLQSRNYNRERPHRALELLPPEPDERQERTPKGAIHRRDRLGGLIHEYYRAAA